MLITWCCHRKSQQIWDFWKVKCVTLLKIGSIFKYSSLRYPFSLCGTKYFSVTSYLIMKYIWRFCLISKMLLYNWPHWNHLAPVLSLLTSASLLHYPACYMSSKWFSHVWCYPYNLPSLSLLSSFSFIFHHPLPAASSPSQLKYLLLHCGLK